MLGKGCMALALACALTIGGCSSTSLLTGGRASSREKALALIDAGKRKEKEGMPLLVLERYDRAVQIYASPEGWFRMGRIFEAQGENDKAATAYQEALKLAHDFQDARLALIALGYAPAGTTPSNDELTQAGEWATQHQQELAALRPKPQAGAAATTDTLAAQRAEALAEAASLRVPTSSEVRAVLFAPDSESQDKLPSATDPVYPDDQDVIVGTYAYHYQRAEMLRTRNQWDKAADEYLRAIQADPKALQARLDLGDMMRRLERDDRARLYYQRAHEDFPDSPRPLLKLGAYYKDLKQPDRAREYFRKALEKDPKYVEAHNNLAVMEMEEQRFIQAARMFEEIMKLNPEYPTAYLNRGIIASEVEKKPAEALTLFRRYVELNGPRAAEVRKWIEELEGGEVNICGLQSIND